MSNLERQARTNKGVRLSELTEDQKNEEARMYNKLFNLTENNDPPPESDHDDEELQSVSFSDEESYTDLRESEIRSENSQNSGSDQGRSGRPYAQNPNSEMLLEDQADVSLFLNKNSSPFTHIIFYSLFRNSQQISQKNCFRPKKF